MSICDCLDSAVKVIMEHVQLATFNNSSYHPGRGLAWQLAWFFFGLPLLRSAWLPFSGVRVRLLRAFGASIGKGVVIKPGVRVKYPWRLWVDDHCWLGEDCWIDNIADVRIGSDVCLSQGSYLCTGNHDWTDPSFRLTEQPITVENGAWVGAKATVCPGVTIGIGAIVAAGSVANRTIPAYEVHAGNPAKFVRRREIRNRSAMEGAAAIAGEAEIPCESYS
jgi:putative colanic acid biosynthesis acetyltransferase WcaF